MGNLRYWQKLPADVAAVAAAAAKIQSDTTLLGVAGTYNVAAADAASKAAQLAADVAAVTAAAGDILSSRTLLGVAGTLAAKTITLTRFGVTAGEVLDLTGANIGAITLTTCFTAAVKSTLTLAGNRMGQTAVDALISDIYAAIVTNASGADVDLDISGDQMATPSDASWDYIARLASVEGSTITANARPVTASGNNLASAARGEFAWVANQFMFTRAGGCTLFWTGTQYVLYDGVATFHSTTLFGSDWHDAAEADTNIVTA
jgi:hypothetical protein